MTISKGKYHLVQLLTDLFVLCSTSLALAWHRDIDLRS